MMRHIFCILLVALVIGCQSRRTSSVPLLCSGEHKNPSGDGWEDTFQDSGPRTIGEPCCPGGKVKMCIRDRNGIAPMRASRVVEVDHIELRLYLVAVRVVQQKMCIRDSLSTA